MKEEFSKGRPSFIGRNGRRKKSPELEAKVQRFNEHLLVMKISGMRLREIAEHHDMSIGAIWPRIENARSRRRNEVA